MLSNVLPNAIQSQCDNFFSGYIRQYDIFKKELLDLHEAYEKDFSYEMFDKTMDFLWKSHFIVLKTPNIGLSAEDVFIPLHKLSDKLKPILQDLKSLAEKLTLYEQQAEKKADAIISKINADVTTTSKKKSQVIDTLLGYQNYLNGLHSYGDEFYKKAACQNKLILKLRLESNDILLQSDNYFAVFDRRYNSFKKQLLNLIDEYNEDFSEQIFNEKINDCWNNHCSYNIDGFPEDVVVEPLITLHTEIKKRINSLCKLSKEFFDFKVEAEIYAKKFIVKINTIREESQEKYQVLENFESSSSDLLVLMTNFITFNNLLRHQEDIILELDKDLIVKTWEVREMLFSIHGGAIRDYVPYKKALLEAASLLAKEDENVDFHLEAKAIIQEAYDVFNNKELTFSINFCR